MGFEMAHVFDTGLTGFDNVLSQLKKHSDRFGATRAGWNGKGLAIYLQTPTPQSKMTLPYFYLEYPGDHPTQPFAKVPWFPSTTDMLAEDWILVCM